MPLKGKQYKLDVDGDKKITRKDFMILAKNTKNMILAKNTKNKKKNGNKSA